MMDISSRWQSSTTATYRFPLWWPPEMVVVPTVPKEGRDQVIRRATSRVRSTVTAYPQGLLTNTQIVCPHKPL